MKIKMLIALLFVALMTMGFDCVNNNALIAVDIQSLNASFPIDPSNPSFNKCITVSNYLDLGFGNLQNARIYDIRVSTSGSYPNGSASGTAQIQFMDGGVQRTFTINYSGAWSSFQSPKSLLTSLNSTQLEQLSKAVLGGVPITLCGTGSVSPSSSVPGGLTLVFTVYAQVDGEL